MTTSHPSPSKPIIDTPEQAGEAVIQDVNLHRRTILRCALATLGAGSVNMLLGCGSGSADSTKAASAASTHAPVVSGPLAGLPSAVGTHIAQIKALGADSWLNLGPPLADPKWGKAHGRAWGGRALILAPDLRGAFFYGEGVHAWVKPDGHIMDDLWFYDINKHRWIMSYPGTDTATFSAQVKSGALVVDSNGQLTDNKGQPIPVHAMIHAWDLLSYDTNLRRFAICTDGGGIPGRYYLGGGAAMDEGMALIESQYAARAAKPMSPYFYDVATGKFDRQAIPTARPSVGAFPYFQYHPSLKRYFVLGSDGVTSYDPAIGAWTLVSDTGPRPQGYDHGGCYDSKRDRIYMSTNYSYDIKRATWTKSAWSGSPPAGYRTADASVFYDSVNDVVTVFQYTTKTIHTWQPDTTTWTVRPFPLNVLHSAGGNANSAFYDAELNAYFVYIADDSDGRGIMWVYRYK